MPHLFLILVILFSFSCTKTTVYRIDGSSTVYPISEAAVEEFVNHLVSVSGAGPKIIIGVSGTGGGFKKFCRAEIDIAEASRPIKSKEKEDCEKAGVEYIEVMVAYDATVVAVHPKNPLTQISVEQLKNIWKPESQGVVTDWNQIASDQSGRRLKLFGAGTDSGTFEYFTEVVMGKSKSSRGDYTASEDDNIIIQGIANDEGSLGYIPFAYYVENKDKIKSLAVIGDNGQPVAPSIETVMDKTYAPLSRPLYLYIRKSSLKNKDFYDFINYYFTHATDLVSSAKYVPLDKEQYDIELKKITDILEK